MKRRAGCERSSQQEEITGTWCHQSGQGQAVKLDCPGWRSSCDANQVGSDTDHYLALCFSFLMYRKKIGLPSGVNEIIHAFLAPSPKHEQTLGNLFFYG
jgi:hypothetical protein